MSEHRVVVTGARLLTPRIRELLLTSADGQPLPPYEPGSHISVAVAGESGGAPERRDYSLIGGAAEIDDPPQTYRIAVERRAAGGGTSRFLHDGIGLGAQLAVAAPRNAFPLSLHPASRVLVAAGIGITPIYAMLRRLAARGLPFALYYLGAAPEEMAYRAEIERLAGTRAQFHCDDAFARDPDFAPIFAALDYPAEVYVCASDRLNRRVVDAALDSGLSRLQIHQQCFAPAPPVDNGNTAFEVELRRSGVTVSVPADASILEALLASGHPARFYCGRGECGTCPLPVIAADGPIEHRDHFLSPEDKASNARLCICVSRLKGTRLVLDA